MSRPGGVVGPAFYHGDERPDSETGGNGGLEPFSGSLAPIVGLGTDSLPLRDKSVPAGTH